MARDIVLTNPNTMAAPGGHYSHAVKANGFVFVAGQLPIAHDGAKLMDAPFEQQAQQTLDNIAAALKAAGSAIYRLVQVRVYVTDIGFRGLPLTPSMRHGSGRHVRPARLCRCHNCITASRLKLRRSR